MLFIERLNFLQVVETIYFKANILLISVFYFRECKWLCLWKLFKTQECAKYFESTNFHHSVVDVELRLNFNAMIVDSILLFLICFLSKLINDCHHWEIEKFVESWWRLQSISWCSFNFTSVRKELKNINWLISRRNHSVLHTVSSCLMYFWMTWEFVSWISTIFIYILFMSFKFWYVQYFKLTRWASFSFHTYSCWFTIKFIISMFTHVVIWKKDRLKSVSVTNHLQDFLFMILNRLMILNIWIIFLCISFMINQFHLIFQNFHIDCDCFALELAFWK